MGASSSQQQLDGIISFCLTATTKNFDMCPSSVAMAKKIADTRPHTVVHFVMLEDTFMGKEREVLTSFKKTGNCHSRTALHQMRQLSKHIINSLVLLLLIMR